MKYNPIVLKIDDLLLDPNNPRFSKFHKHETGEELYADPEIQEDTFKKMIEHQDVHEVENSITKTGFLDLDPIFVRKVKGTNKYVVLEGNRRISAIKSLLEKHKKAESSSDVLTEEVLESLLKIPCKDLTGFDETEIDYMLGLRHGGSIKQWEPLPASANLYKMYMREFCQKNSCENSLENFKLDSKILKSVAAGFSITTGTASKRLKSYRVYADLAEARPVAKQGLETKYSVIEEMLSKPVICKELNYDPETCVFDVDGHDRFFDIVFGDKNNNIPPIITGAAVGGKEGSSVRDFAAVLSLSEGSLRGEFVDKRLYENREFASKLKSELEVREMQRTLQTALSSAAAELGKITQGELINNSEIGEAEIELLDKIKAIIADIDIKISRNRR